MRPTPARIAAAILLAIVVFAAVPGCIVISGSSGGPPSDPGIAANAQDAPSAAEIDAAVKSIVRKNSTGVPVQTVENVKLVKDEKGVWWVGATAVPVDPTHFDQVPVYIYRDATGWKLYDLGTGIEAKDLPESVRSIAQ